MANPPKDFHAALLVLNGLLLFVVAACLMYLVLWIVAGLAQPGAQPRVISARSGHARRRRRGRPVRLGLRAPLSTLGVLTVIASPAAAYRRAPAAPSWRAADSAAPPWSATSGFPPPRPLVRIRAPQGAEAKADARVENRRLPAERAGARESDGRSSVVARGYRLRGVREGREDRRGDDGAAKARSMAEHPAGKGSGRGCPPLNPQHVVVADDTLWDIAAGVLRTTDLARVARYWPKIHRNNREIIGPDPSLIYPGSVLVLPPECPE